MRQGDELLTREGFRYRFGERAVFGMVHLRPLPGAPLFGRSIDEVIATALFDARAIEEGGAAGIVIENFGDRPFEKSRVGAETVAAMTRVIVEISRAATIPIGVNVLRNDAASALAIAAATGAAFIRVNVHTGAMLADQGIIEGDAASTLRLRRSLAPTVAIFADHLVKHATPLGDVDAVQAAKDLRHRGLADAVIVSGAETGAPADAQHLRELRAMLADTPLVVGSGLTPENAATFADADAAIVGTAIKREGEVDRAVDAERVRAVVRAFSAG